MGRSHRFGRRAEDQVASYLRARGWTILARNWRFHRKEIDLVAGRQGTVAFVEVKARGADGWAHPLHAIDRSKRRELAVAARGWVALRGRPGECYRFDVAVVIRHPGGTVVDYIEDAWRP